MYSKGLTAVLGSLHSLCHPCPATCLHHELQPYHAVGPERALVHGCAQMPTFKQAGSFLRKSMDGGPREEPPRPAPPPPQLRARRGSTMVDMLTQVSCFACGALSGCDEHMSLSAQSKGSTMVDMLMQLSCFVL
eukprot:841986-Pelagomonas_calceolata.AAC.3